MKPSIFYIWTDQGTWKPLDRFTAECDGLFYVGEVRQLEIVEPRSRISHDHYFVCLREAYLQLPEMFHPEFHNEEKFRKWLLIQAGYCDETRFMLASPEEAFKFAAYCAGLDEYAVIDVQGNFVSIRKAVTQSKKAMGNRLFQESKQAVFDVYYKLTGIDPTTLKRNAGKAA